MPATSQTLVVQSIYNARRAPAFQITAQYYWRRTCGRRFPMLPIVRRQQWCDTMNSSNFSYSVSLTLCFCLSLSLPLSLHCALHSNNYHPAFRGNTTDLRLKLPNTDSLCELIMLIKYIYREYSKLHKIYICYSYVISLKLHI